MKAPLKLRIFCSCADVWKTRSYLVSQELARQSPEGVKGQETARQVHQLEFLHLRVDEELGGGQRRNAGSGRVGDVHACKYHNDTRSHSRQEFEDLKKHFWSFQCL